MHGRQLHQNIYEHYNLFYCECSEQSHWYKIDFIAWLTVSTSGETILFRDFQKFANGSIFVYCAK